MADTPDRCSNLSRISGEFLLRRRLGESPILDADLAELCKSQTDAAAARNSVKQWLLSWQANTDLAGVREPAELAKLSEDERWDWLALWKEVADAIERM